MADEALLKALRKNLESASSDGLREKITAAIAGIAARKPLAPKKKPQKKEKRK